MFGRNGITISAEANICINGAVHTNKEANVSYLNGNINGKITTGSDIEKRVKHVYADRKIMETYFTENCDLHEEEYVYSDMNIHINNPLFCYSNFFLDGNVALNSHLGSLMNLNITGEVKNANTSVVYSKYGDITIENDSTANINGLIYAPLGTLTINSPNINLNGVIIADKIVINGDSVNINYKDDMASFIGTKSEVYDFSGLEHLPEDWLGDTDKDELFDIYEKVIDTDPFNPDTDGDGLPDGYEVLTLNTDPLEVDTDENGVSDANEDFDSDNLNNLGEYQNKTEPYNPDTDDDGFLDGDEINKYKTDPLNPDTDNDGLLDGEESYDGSIYTKYGVYFDPLNPDTNGNGILDGNEVFGQSKKQEVSTHDEAITEIKVDMDTNGNLERNLTVESMYNIDAMSTNVYSLIGEPFNFTSATDFKSATITFKIDKSKLGDTKFDNLLILWYNEEEQIFEEMETIHDEANSTVSTTTTHFSQYMIVDSEKWYANWEASFNEFRRKCIGGTTTYKVMNTIFVIDCCSDMGRHDPNNQRLNICSNIVNGMMSEDRAAVITYSEFGTRGRTGLTDKNSALSVLRAYINDSGAKSNLIPAFEDALYIANSSTADMNRIIILTNGNTTFTFDLDNYNLSNVTVNVVDMGGYTMGNSLVNVASVTGGDVYSIARASDLAYQSGEEIYTPPQFNDKDSDGDGIPDIVEEYGLKPNGEPINTNPRLADTDGDGIPDNIELKYIGEQLILPITYEQYLASIYCGSDPAKADSDDDGLNDGKRQYYKGKVLLPIDPNPLIYNGPKGVWKAQKRMLESGNIPTAYTSNPTGTNPVMSEMAENADDLVDILLTVKVLANEYIIDAVEYLFKDSAENRPAAIAGADFLDFVYDEYNMAYHSQPGNWQRAFGYNDIYDDVFEYASNMDKNKIEFKHNGEKHILWSWKGDYWNLQSGAETGLYVYNRTVNGVEHYDVVDFELPMTLSLYNLYDDHAENVFSWVPNDPQWWITGFNPEFTEPDPNTMAMICSVDFKDDDLYKNFKNTRRSDKEQLIFDDDHNTVWIIW